MHTLQNTHNHTRSGHDKGHMVSDKDNCPIPHECTLQAIGYECLGGMSYGSMCLVSAVTLGVAPPSIRIKLTINSTQEVITDQRAGSRVDGTC